MLFNLICKSKTRAPSQTFKEHEDLLRNMMGLLGNVAEVRHLRCRLLTPELIDTFTGLLKSSSGGIEVGHSLTTSFFKLDIK
jgi:hypothetical protein